MSEPHHGHVDMGIVHFMVYPETMSGDGPILETVREIATDPFFGAIEVGPINDDETRRKTGELLEQANMRVGFGAQPMLLGGDHNLNDPSDEARAAAIDVVKEGIDQAVELGAERVGILSGPAPNDTADRPEQLELLEDSIAEICTYAAANGGVGVTLETFDPQTDKCALIGGSHEEAAELARSLRDDGHDFGIMIDLSHLPMQALEPPFTTPRADLAALGETLVHVHIGNCVIHDTGHPAYGDLHPRFGIGEIGERELQEFLETLFASGYLGGDDRPIVSFEVAPVLEEDPDIVIANAKRTFNRAWGSIAPDHYHFDS